MGAIAVLLIFLPFLKGALSVGEAFAFRKSLKKQMIKSLPELEQPKSREEASDMRQVFDEIGFFDYLDEYEKNSCIAYFALLLFIFTMFFVFLGGSLDSLSWEPVAFWSAVVAILAFPLIMDFRQKKGFIRICRDHAAFSECSDEKCVSLLQYDYYIYKDYRQRYNEDKDQVRWGVICGIGVFLLICLVIVIYEIYYNYKGLGSEPLKSQPDIIQYEILEDGSLKVTAYKGNEEVVKIPGSLNGHPVSVIGVEAFKENRTIKSVEFPDGIVAIEARAFHSCTNLERAELPQGVRKIGDSAFAYCTSLKEIHLPDGIREIDDSAFAFCIDLTEIHLPDGVRVLGDSAFTYCYSLTEMQLPDSVEEFGEFLFSGCSGLQMVNLPPQMEEIPDKMFAGCEKLTSFSIPDRVHSIGERSFAGTGITMMELPNGIKSIGDQAFSECLHLESITIPDSLESIGNNPFACCQVLENIGISDGNPCVKIVDGVLFSADGRRLICYPQIRDETEYMIPERTDHIDSYAFESCVCLEKVILPQSLTHIGDFAFYGCKNLKEIQAQGSLDHIGYGAFKECPGLSEDMLPDAETKTGR